MKLLLAYCLYIRPIFTKRQRNYRFTPIDSNAVAGPPLPIAIYGEIGDAILNRREFRDPHVPYMKPVSPATIL